LQVQSIEFKLQSQQKKKKKREGSQSNTQGRIVMIRVV
jgi:hypothetical protein